MLKGRKFIIIWLAVAVSTLSGIASAQQAFGQRRRAQIRGVTYAFHPRIMNADLGALKRTANGKYVLPGKVLHYGDIVVDQARNRAYKVLAVDAQGAMTLGRPALNEVFSDLKIPRQDVDLTHAEYISLQPEGVIRELNVKRPEPVRNVGPLNSNLRTSPSSAPKTGGQKVMSLPSADNENKKFIEKECNYFSIGPKAYGYTEDGQEIKLTLEGTFGFCLGLDVKYDPFDGYDFGLKGGEFCRFKAVLSANIDKEVYIPIFSIPINIPSIGTIKAGIFAVVGIQGKFEIVAAMDEGLWAKAGVRGDTFFFVPTSFEPYAESRKYFGAEFNPSGRLAAHCYLTPALDIQILGCDVFAAEIRLGLDLEATQNEKLIDYGAYLAAHVFVVVLGERVDLYKDRVAIFHRRKEAGKGQGQYEFQLGKLCAYRDQFAGRVLKAKTFASQKTYVCTDCGSLLSGPPESCPVCGASQTSFLENVFGDKEPHVGSLTLRYYRNGSLIRNIDVATDSGGVFRYDFMNDPQNSADRINVIKGDSVQVAVPEDPEAVSDPVHAQIPWDTLRLHFADFFQEIAVGTVDNAVDTPDVPPPGKGIHSTLPKKILAYEGPVTVVLRNKDGSGEIPLAGHCVKDKAGNGRFVISSPAIVPFKEVYALAVIDGFELKTGVQTTSHNIIFNKWRLDQDSYLRDGAIHYIQHKFVAINTVGLKVIDQVANLTISLGKTPKSMIEALAPVYVHDGDRLSAVNSLFFEYNPDKTMGQVIHSLAGTLPIRPLNYKGGTPRNPTRSIAQYEWRWDESKKPPAKAKLKPQKDTAVDLAQLNLRRINAPIEASAGKAKPAYTVFIDPGRNPADSMDWTEWYHVKTEISFLYKGYLFKAIQFPIQTASAPEIPQESMSPAAWAIFGRMISRIDPSPLSQYKPGFAVTQQGQQSVK